MKGDSISGYKKKYNGIIKQGKREEIIVLNSWRETSIFGYSVKGAENVNQIINLIVFLKQTEELKKLRETMGIVSKDFSIEMGLFEVEELTYLKEGIIE